MAPATTTKRTLSTAEERREAVLEAAMGVFCERGYLGTPTKDVAEAAGISQAYLFRLFPTKSDLVVAVARRANDRIREAFVKAAAEAKAAGEDPGEAMGRVFGDLLEDRTLLLNLVHQFAAAASMPEVAEASRASFAELVALVERETGRDAESLQGFFAHGMLMNTMAAIGAPGRDERWARILTGC